MILLELVLGLALLLGGGEALVKGSVGVARRMGVSPLLIGLTLVGFGTSTPELVASLQAALGGSPAIALGNVVGSNIANVLLILGLAALVYPLATTKEAFRRDGAVLLAVSLALLLVVVLIGSIGRGLGLLFLALLAAYTVFAYLSERDRKDPAAAVHEAEAADALPGDLPLAWGVALALGGIAAVVVGADFLVGAAITIARTAGISETVIGLTLVAVGTSLPELVTSVLAAWRRHADVAFGNIVGSNIFNVLGIAGLTAVVTPLPVPPQIASFDIWVMVAAAVLLILFAATGWRVQRWEGRVFLAAYAAYLALQLA